MIRNACQARQNEKVRRICWSIRSDIVEFEMQDLKEKHTGLSISERIQLLTWARNFIIMLSFYPVLNIHCLYKMGEHTFD